MGPQGRPREARKNKVHQVIRHDLVDGIPVFDQLRSSCPYQAKCQCDHGICLERLGDSEQTGPSIAVTSYVSAVNLRICLIDTEREGTAHPRLTGLRSNCQANGPPVFPTVRTPWGMQTVLLQTTCCWCPRQLAERREQATADQWKKMNMEQLFNFIQL